MARLAQTRPCIVIFCNICRNTDRMGSTDRYRTVHLIIIHSQISAALNNSDQKFSRRPRNKLHDSTRSRRAFPGTADFSALRSGHRFVPIKPRRAFFATSHESVVATVLAVPPAARRAAKTPHEIRAAFYTRRSQ